MTSHLPAPGIPAIPEPTPAPSKVDWLMPRSAAHWIAAVLKLGISQAPRPLAVPALPRGTTAVVVDGNGEARVAFLAPAGAALRTGGPLRPRFAPPKSYAFLCKLIENVHGIGQWITSLSKAVSLAGISL